jgi:RimJ/RimL family protein N-acetyltransferase
MPMEIRGRTCLLRPLVASDAASLAAHADDRDVWLNLRDRFPHPYTVHDAATYIAAMAPSSRPISFGIIVEGEAAGTIGLVPGEDIARATAEIGYWLGRRFWGRGVITEAVRATTRYAFAELGLHRVFAVPFVHNTASSRVLEKAGYVREGRMRRSALKAGEVLDQWLYAAYDDHPPPEPAG